MSATFCVPGIVSYPGTTYLLDESGLGSAYFAYSVRKLRSAYAGSAIRVRHSSDNSEQDIGFSGENLDTSSLLSFCGGGNGFITTWYDQSGNSRNATQSTTGEQPQIVSSGTLITDNSIAALQFTHTSNSALLLPTGLLNGITSLSWLGVWNIASGFSNGGVFGPSTTSGVGLQWIANVGGNISILRFNATNKSNSTSFWSNDSQFIDEMYADGSSTVGYKNGSSVSLTDSSGMPSLNFNGVYAIARYDNALSNDSTMKAQEIVCRNSNIVASRTALYNNVNNYY